MLRKVFKIRNSGVISDNLFKILEGWMHICSFSFQKQAVILFFNHVVICVYVRVCIYLWVMFLRKWSTEMLTHIRCPVMIVQTDSLSWNESTHVTSTTCSNRKCLKIRELPWGPIIINALKGPPYRISQIKSKWNQSLYAAFLCSTFCLWCSVCSSCGLSYNWIFTIRFTNHWERVKGSHYDCRDCRFTHLSY